MIRWFTTNAITGITSNVFSGFTALAYLSRCTLGYRLCLWLERWIEPRLYWSIAMPRCVNRSACIFSTSSDCDSMTALNWVIVIHGRDGLLTAYSLDIFERTPSRASPSVCSQGSPRSNTCTHHYGWFDSALRGSYQCIYVLPETLGPTHWPASPPDCSTAWLPWDTCYLALNRSRIPIDCVDTSIPIR